MIKVLAALHDELGNVAIKGLNTFEFAELPYTEANLRQDSSLVASATQIGEGSIMQRIWGNPAITVIGIDAPSVAVSSNTLLPSVKAKISMRIAPGQDPEAALELLKAHLLESAAFGAQITFGKVELGKPFSSDAGGWAQTLAKSSLAAAFGNETVEIGIGGSIPFIADLTEVFPAAQILVTGVEDSDSRAHSPNESVHLVGLQNAMVAEALFLLRGNELSH